jgi:hypothetical protein
LKLLTPFIFTADKRIAYQHVPWASRFSGRHRFLDSAPEEHSVLVVVDRMLDEPGAVAGNRGYQIDVTETMRENRKEVLDETLPSRYSA